MGSRLTGRGTTFAAGIEWAVENGMDVCNVSMGTTKKNFFGLLHSLADRANPISRTVRTLYAYPRETDAGFFAGCVG